MTPNANACKWRQTDGYKDKSGCHMAMGVETRGDVRTQRGAISWPT